MFSSAFIGILVRMSRKYFGTDGIRGQANTAPMTADMALKVAMAAAIVMREAQIRDKTDRVIPVVALRRNAP